MKHYRVHLIRGPSIDSNEPGGGGVGGGGEWEGGGGGGTVPDGVQVEVPCRVSPPTHPSCLIRG